jgi:hypothetical protein
MESVSVILRGKLGVVPGQHKADMPQEIIADDADKHE